MGEAAIEWRAGDYAAAEFILREGIAGLEAIGERAFYPTAALQLASLLYTQGRFDEVREWCEKARASTGADDLTNFLDLDLLEGCLLAREGRFVDAEAAARRAIERAEGIDMNEIQALAHRYLAEIFALLSKHREAGEHASRSLAIAESKGDVALAARVREQLAAVGVEVA